jgi:hypothetical protein
MSGDVVQMQTNCNKMLGVTVIVMLSARRCWSALRRVRRGVVLDGRRRAGSDDVDHQLMFAGHNAYRFAQDPFYAGGFIPTVKQLVDRIATGD